MARSKRAGFYELPEQTIKEIGRDAFLREVYYLNEEKMPFSMKTGDIYSYEQFKHEIESNIKWGKNTLSAIRSFSRSSDVATGGEEIQQENIINSLKGNREIQRRIREEFGLKSYKDLDIINDFYWDDLTGMYIHRSKKNVGIRFAQFTKDNPYHKGKPIIEIVRLEKDGSKRSKVQHRKKKKTKAVSK